MKKLVYILFAILIGSCAIISTTSNYLYDKSIHSGYLYDNYQNHHWVGHFEGDTFNLKIDTLIENRRFFGELEINNDSAKFWVSKNQLGFWDESDTLKRKIRDSLKRKKYSQYRKFWGPVKDSLYISKRFENGTSINIPLIKKENEYFQPYYNYSLINYLKYSNENRLKIELKSSSTIVAVKMGKVTRVNKRCGNGQHIIIKHENGFSSMYGSKYSKIKVKEGDFVEKGEIIGITESNKRDIVDFSFLLMKDNKRINPLLIFE